MTLVCKGICTCNLFC